MQGLASEVSSSSGPPLPPPGLVIGRVETNPLLAFSEEELYAFVAGEQVRDGALPAKKKRKKSDAQCRETVKELRNALCYGGHPSATDESVRYSIFKWPNHPGDDYTWITIRWWTGRDDGYYFDFVDITGRKVIDPPFDMLIMHDDDGDLGTVYSQESYERNGMPKGQLEEQKSGSYSDWAKDNLSREAYEAIKKNEEDEKANMDPITKALMWEDSGEERYLVPSGATLVLHRRISRGELKPTVVVYAPIQKVDRWTHLQQVHPYDPRNSST